MGYEFDDDTRLSRIDEQTFQGRVTERWNIGDVPNGGYLLGIALAGFARALPEPDPLTATIHFLRRAAAGDVRVLVEMVKSGRRLATGTARLVQGAAEIARVLATFGDLSRDEGPRYVDGRPPALPPVTSPPPPRLGAHVEVQNRIDTRPDPASFGFVTGQPSERAEVRAWMRFADGRPPDVRSLAFFADALPPPVFHVVPPGWVPTIELTVHFRARPAPGWLAGVFRTRFVTRGYLEADGELWDETGELVALSRQLARLPRAPGA
jgi:acyl-CoA thioesterase